MMGRNLTTRKLTYGMSVVVLLMIKMIVTALGSTSAASKQSP